MADLGLIRGKIFQPENDHYEYMMCSLQMQDPVIRDILIHLNEHGTLNEQHLLRLGLSRWSFYMRFDKSFDFMVQRVKKQRDVVELDL